MIWIKWRERRKEEEDILPLSDLNLYPSTSILAVPMPTSPHLRIPTAVGVVDRR